MDIIDISSLIANFSLFFTLVFEVFIFYKYHTHVSEIVKKQADNSK